MTTYTYYFLIFCQLLEKNKQSMSSSFITSSLTFISLFALKLKSKASTLHLNHVIMTAAAERLMDVSLTFDACKCLTHTAGLRAHVSAHHDHARDVLAVAQVGCTD